MKILAVISSYRKNGNTEKIVSLLKEELILLSEKSDIKINFDTVHLAQRNIQVCRGCRICFDKGENFCPLKDDLLEIKQKISETDVLVLASPVYVEDVNGIMKNWIDRMAFICHRPEFFGKFSYSLSTSGVGSTNHTLMTLNSALRVWGLSVIGQRSFITGALMDKEEIVKLYKDKIFSTAKRILKYYQTAKNSCPTFFSLMVFKIQQLYYKREQDKTSIDYIYWKSKGWLNDKCFFYSSYKANIFKVTAARILGVIVTKLVLN